jgi:hypothetical protein
MFMNTYIPGCCPSTTMMIMIMMNDDDDNNNNDHSDYGDDAYLNKLKHSK